MPRHGRTLPAENVDHGQQHREAGQTQGHSLHRQQLGDIGEDRTDGQQQQHEDGTRYRIGGLPIRSARRSRLLLRAETSKP